MGCRLDNFSLQMHKLQSFSSWTLLGAVRKYVLRQHFLRNVFVKWKTGGSLTHVILVVDYRVLICLAAGVSMYWLCVIGPVVCMDGSLELTL